MFKIGNRNLSRTTCLGRRRTPRYQPNLNTMGPRSRTIRHANMDIKNRDIFEPDKNDIRARYENAHYRVFKQGIEFTLFYLQIDLLIFILSCVRRDLYNKLSMVIGRSMYAI